VLAVILHGDLLEASPAPTYHYQFGREAAQQLDDLVAVAILRPGYADETLDRSEGRRGMRTGDNYTPEVVDAVGQVVDQLKSKFLPRATVLIGHSGGAAIVGDLLGRRPDEVEGALLVSCPCDVNEWRKEMVKSQFRNVGPLSLLFLLPVRSLSPSELTASVSPAVRVRLVVGQNDPTAPPTFTLRYAQALERRGVNASVAIAPGIGHNILLEPVVMENLKGLLKSIVTSGL
jgi:pimeloyl-ACP methyl ester carboxylesterase